MSKTILLVEDDNCLRDSLSVILEGAGHAVVSAGEGQTALKNLQQQQFDAVILDNNLPFIQGKEILNLIRIQNPGIKVVLMSGFFKAEDVSSIQKQGADFVIEKPFEPETLLRYLDAIHDRP